MAFSFIQTTVSATVSVVAVCMLLRVRLPTHVSPNVLLLDKMIIFVPPYKRSMNDLIA